LDDKDTSDITILRFSIHPLESGASEVQQASW
jgi:hypothetical protein